MPTQNPEVRRAEVAGKCVTANTVGGDFFSYLPGNANHQVGLVVADVAGHAMKAAMNAVMTDGILSMAVEDLGVIVPGRLISRINDVLTARMESDMNVTMVIGLLDTEAMTLTLANAAHHAHPLLLRDGTVQPLKARGLPLGMRASVEYHEGTFDLRPGDVLVLMTDGIIEARDSEGRMYGESGRLERLLVANVERSNVVTLNEPANGSAATLMNAIIHDAIDFSGGQCDDDMTVVVAKVGAR